MAYSGGQQARQVREVLGKTLASLQLDPSIPAQGAEVSSFIAQAIGSLFVAENAPNEAVGGQAVRAALGLLGQSLAKIQTVPPSPAIESAMSGLAEAMGLLFPLTMTPEPAAAAQVAVAPVAAAPAPVAAAPATTPHPNALPARGDDLHFTAVPVAQPAASPKLITQPAPTSSFLSGGSSPRTSKSTLLFAEIPAPVVSITTTHEDSYHRDEPAAPPAAKQPAPQHHAPVAHQPAPQQHAPVAQQPAPQHHAPVAQQPVPQHHAPVAQQPVAPVVQPVAPVARPTAAIAPDTALPSTPAAPPTGSPLWGAGPTPAALAPAPAPESHLTFARPAASSPGTVSAHAETTPPEAPVAPKVVAESKPYVAPAPVNTAGRTQLEANIGLRTTANFWVGFEDEIARGGVFVPTYSSLEPGAAVVVLVTLPEGASFESAARVRFVRDPSESDVTLEPGLGLAFESLAADHRDIARKFIMQRDPLFYDLA